MERYLRKVLHGEPLDEREAEVAMTLMLTGAARPEQIGALLTALHFRTPVADELFGFTQAMRNHSASSASGDDLRADVAGFDLLDVCGTGGDGKGTFNVSTAVAFVVAGTGQAVAKHGNRAVSSRCGSFDVLEALGVPFATSRQEALRSLEKFNIAFLYAPSFYPGLQTLGPLRKSLGVRTVFNALGPLLNPLRPTRQLMGVYAENLLTPIAECLRRQGLKEAMVVRGADGTDEVSLEGLTHIRHMQNGRVTGLTLAPEHAGLARCSGDALVGGDVTTNATLLLSVLRGEPGACRDVTLLNAAVALQICGKASTLVEGIAVAADSVDSGAAFEVLKALRTGARQRYA
jgi:anthranilate phosphoribosyltransferase